MRQIDFLGWQLPVLLVDVIACTIALAAALLVHFVAIAILRRLAKRSPIQSDDILLDYACRPLKWILITLSLAAVRPHLHLDAAANGAWSQAAGLIVPAAIGWLAVAVIRAMQRIVEVKTDISVANNLAARRRRTRSAILGRIALFVTVFITACLMLFSIPTVRSVGVTLMASAGLAALAVGAAAQPALKNLIAGIQMAFTEPIRIDDVVIVDGEWGRIEEIRLTYVVVAVWDQRRLIVPISQFLEHSFQNWTRSESQLLGTAFFYLDPTTDVPKLRAKLEEVVRAQKQWDGRVAGMQVTDIKEQTIEVRALISAANSGDAFDLRCIVREQMMAFIRDEMPEALPRRRAELWPLAADQDAGVPTEA